MWHKFRRCAAARPLLQAALLLCLSVTTGLHRLLLFNWVTRQNATGAFRSIRPTVSMVSSGSSVFTPHSSPYSSSPRQPDPLNCQHLHLQGFSSHWFHSVCSWSSFSSTQTQTGVQLVSVLMRHHVFFCD